MNITILGSGFAALTAIQEIRKLAPDAEITVISPSQELVYLPSLIWIPSGLRKGEDLIIDLTNFFRRQNVKHIAARVEDVLDQGRTVKTNQGDFSNDGLIIASGGRFIKKLPGIEHAITPCEGISAAEAIRDRLNAMPGGTIAIGFGANPNEPSAMRGGPMFEFLFGIETLLRRQGRRDKFELVFFNPSPKPAKRLGDKVPDAVLKMMAERGIRTHLGNKMKGFEANKVITEGGAIDADLILFMPGMTGPAWSQESAIAKSEGGLIKANEYCQVEGMDKTYVAGDSGSYPGPEWQAKQAHMADLQAKAASRNLLAELKGSQQFETFKHELVCIIDILSQGILIKRTERKSLLLPPLRLMHYAKRFFEYWYLRQYR
ncbi:MULTISPECIES: NAD(P)/FAD-dependent oxidoreductase [unclassified Oceanobacter]|uniref:NAD(P)/FAD-dependent oxidoreductase n=1 Tax=unclassified Oceanobacter TaxID=2620260 RepID=UPI002734C564|nr:MULTISPECIES: FAD/NAD(P)-binding oxidoreductase [unclassified Oceanobacter]MDP2506634.1 FAD/NAD(P)-binding oxidoreductase [Oceanobacter sp. 3_MG-2023]MDP2548699.1 FAD/NAD(P)-binding oxidoreductase [Oceanobacter sp. 4_MG-2023]